MIVQTALKEWSAVVEAIASGEQILLVRKGGIRDPQGAFTLRHREFLLYPTQEHQKERSIRPEFREHFRESLRTAAEPTDVVLRIYAGVAFSREIRDPEALTGLEKYHIWMPDFFRDRMQYRPQALPSVLVVRAYRFKRPILRPVLPEYAGCKSWLSLKEPVSLKGAEPVLDNRRFLSALEEITSKLGN